MKLDRLLEGSPYTLISGSLDHEIQGLSRDSRDPDLQGKVYFALRGSEYNGMLYIADAVGKGVQVVVSEAAPADLIDGITYIVIPELYRYLGPIASRFYNNPSQQMTVIGVTGTNGKTSVASMLHQALSLLGKKVGLISTIEYMISDTSFPSSHTTPDALELHRLFAHMQESGCEYVCMEVSSHALDQQRVSVIDFDMAVFTNLSQDHLDYHLSMEAYAAAKKQFFDMLKKEAKIVINRDDAYAAMMVKDTHATVYRYGKKKLFGRNRFAFSKIQYASDHMSYLIGKEKISTSLIGLFNVYNLTAVYATLNLLGFTDPKLMLRLKAPQGRMERISDLPFLAVVDYAHTPDALEKCLLTLKQIPHNKIITVVGCGGDRDTGKRAPMASFAQKLSDQAIFTSDNPRSESQEAIFKDMRRGVDTRKDTVTYVEDRREAIEEAVSLAQEGDILLVAGKGHETYQIIGKEKHHFSDQEEILRAYKKQS